MRVASLHTYPIKGCHRVDQDRAAVEPWGLAGDRRWLIVDAATGKAITQRDLTRPPVGSSCGPTGGPTSGSPSRWAAS